MKDRAFLSVLGGTAAVFVGAVAISYLIHQRVDWLWAVSIAAFWGLAFGFMSFMRMHKKRLQWRLTFSYTVVTVAALLVLELLLLLALLVFLRSNFLIDAMSIALYDLYAVEARQYLQTEPPDLAGLNNWMQRTFDGRTPETTAADAGFSVARNLGEPGNGGDWRFSFGEGQPVYLLDDEGYLLAQNSPLPDFVAGERPFGERPFAFDTIPQLIERFTAVQQGERELDKLRYTLPGGYLVNVLPLVDDDDRLLGVLIFTLPLPALNSETVGPLLTMILYSLIPLALMAGFIGTIFGFLTARPFTRRIGAVAQAADKWSRGDFTAVASDASQDELGQLSRRLNQMAEQLQNLLQTRQELAALEERNRLARDLHDAVKQQIFATAMQIGAARTMLVNNPEAAANRLAEAEALARQAQQELASLIQELRPAALDGQGLAAALRDYAANWSRQNNIPVEFQVQGERPLPLSAEQALFRVGQEALANIARHSGASQVTMRLAWEAGGVVLTIADNGRGFDAQAATSGFGIQGMRERLDALGGRLQLTSQPGKGTMVRAEL
ncbi:MAG TPA: sensor histidine kinase [Chloroflexota bacterium]|nr:sensor histidine kinase [Chloroflexota bacterium]